MPSASDQVLGMHMEDDHVQPLLTRHEKKEVAAWQVLVVVELIQLVPFHMHMPERCAQLD